MSARSCRLTLLVSIALMAACKSAGQGEPEEPQVMLFGHDPGVPSKAPDDCKRVGKIEASSIGKDSFPDDALRAEAAELGANAVTRIKKDGMEEVMLGRKVYFRGTAVSCKNLPKPVPSASAAPPDSGLSDQEVPDMGR
jgi:hypothetical protein